MASNGRGRTQGPVIRPFSMFLKIKITKNPKNKNCIKYNILPNACTVFGIFCTISICKDVINCMESFLDYAGIGKRIRQARLSKKWTQAKLAEAVGCSTANITNIEKAKTKLSLNMFSRITEVLEISADDVLGTTAPPKSGDCFSIEAEIQEICAGLSSEDAQVCRRACVDFCQVFSRHIPQI